MQEMPSNKDRPTPLNTSLHPIPGAHSVPLLEAVKTTLALFLAQRGQQERMKATSTTRFQMPSLRI